MRKIFYLFICLILTSCSWWKNCDTCFTKEKKSKSESAVFTEDVFIETKKMSLFAQPNRMLSIQFKKSEYKNYVVISQTTNTNSFKNALVLGTQIKLGFVFDNDQNYILTFTSAENKNTNSSYVKTSNQTEIDKSFSELLKNHKIISLEVQNPFLGGNETKVKQWDVPTGKRINNIYNCYLLEVGAL